MSTPAHRGALERTLVLVCTTLRAADVRFALTGGAAVYARGGPFSDHDVDVLVRPDAAHHAVLALIEVGMRATDAPEDWLCKVYDGAVPVDIIHRPSEQTVTDAMLDRAEELSVSSTTAPVAPAIDVLEQKLLSLGPHHCDFSWVLPAARALREQIDWSLLRRRIEHWPYAEAFLLLADRLGIPLPEAEPRFERKSMTDDEYAAARLSQALAQDPRTAEQAVQVIARGSTVLLTGEVASAARRDLLTDVVHEHRPGATVINKVGVVPAG